MSEPKACAACGGTGYVKVAHGEVLEDYDWSAAFAAVEGDPPIEKVVYADWEKRVCPRCRPQDHLTLGAVVKPPFPLGPNAAPTGPAHD